MDRRLIPELIAKYRLEPPIRDIYVEGRFDRNVITWFLRNSGIKDVKVFEIETVDVPSEIVKKYSLTGGNKARLLSLAYEVAAQLGENLPQLTCIVDIDCDRILGKQIDCRIVLTTRYTCMEMYLYDEVPLGKFLALVLGLNSIAVDSLMKEYSVVLKELFLIRAAIESLNLPVPWIDFLHSCQRTDEGITFDRDKFIRVLLQNAGVWDKHDVLYSKTEELRPVLDHDPRHSVNGHDFLSLLSHDVASEARRRGLQNASAISAALTGCLETSRLREEQFFRALSDRVTLPVQGF